MKLLDVRGFGHQIKRIDRIRLLYALKSANLDFLPVKIYVFLILNEEFLDLENKVSY